MDVDLVKIGVGVAIWGLNPCFNFVIGFMARFKVELRSDLIPCLCSTKDENEVKVTASVETPGAGFLDPQMQSFISIARSSF